MAFLNTDILELWGSDTATCLDNLDILAARQGRLWESMITMLSELADAIVADAEGDPETVDSILLSLQGPEPGEHPESLTPPTVPDAPSSLADRDSVAPVNRALLGRLNAPMGIVARMTIYRFIEERLPAHKSSTPSPLPGTARGRIAYMAGAFADKAYLRLAATVPGARAAAFHSFVDACEEVRGGLCEYCILPLENTASGKLTAFARLILRYRLCTVAVCDLENGATEGQITRFALLRRAPESGLSDVDTPPDAPAESDRTNAPRYLELLHTVGDPAVSELLGAAAFCGLKLSRIDTLPPMDDPDLLAEADGSPLLACVFDTEGADLHTFRRYLTLEIPEDILMGHYDIIS